MIKELIESGKEILKEAVGMLNAKNRRIILGKISKKIGYGGQTYVAKTFNAGRNTVRMGTKELENASNNKKAETRGRKRVTERLPNLSNDITDIVGAQSQIDPKFQSTRLYTRLTVPEIRKQLIAQKGYTDEELPTNQKLTTLVNELGFTLKSIQKTKPLKKIPETDAIFDTLKVLHEKIENADDVVRLSIDTKDRVKIGEFSRDGKSRVKKNANDHDFGDKYATPFGILNVKEKSVDISISTSKVTADYMVDRLEEYWGNYKKRDMTNLLVINADNGPENSSNRTQFLKRMVEFALKFNQGVLLAYYPPYHSKYNPIERVWGALEKHWNGDILDSLETVIKFTETMTWNGKKPMVKYVDKIYETGKKLSKKAMKVYESVACRLQGLEKWFVLILPDKTVELLN